MAHQETEWRPKGATEYYNGFEVFDHGIFPHDINDGEVDGKVSIEDADVDLEE